MKKSAYYSDLIFTFSLLFFIALFCLRYFNVPLLLTILISILFGGAGAYLLSLHLRKKQKIFALKKSEEEEKNSLLFYLCLISSEERAEFLHERLPFLLKMLDPNEEFPTNAVLSQTPKTENATPTTTEELQLGKYKFFPLFYFREISPDDIAEIFPYLKDATAPVLLCDKISDSGKSLCEKLSVTYLDGALLYRALKDGDCIPSEYPIKTATPLKRKRRNVCFAKSNSRRFFTSGALLLASSVFIPYPIYYLVFGGLFLIISVLVRIFGYR